jgi:ABC-type sulfate transport system permease component
LGSFIFSLLFFLPLYFLANLAIERYRAHLLSWVRKSRVMQAFTASRFYSLYQSVSEWWR